MRINKQIFAVTLLLQLGTFALFAQTNRAKVSITDTLAIISFNDFHGNFAADESNPGAARLVQMTQQEARKYPHSIVVCGGDNFSGTYFSKITKGKPLKEMFDAMNVEVSAVGNHEFDWGQPYLIDTAACEIPYIAANITEKEAYSHPGWLTPYRIVERPLKNGSTFRVAFVGLTTTDTADKTTKSNLTGIQFTHPLGAACIQTVYELKKEGNIDLVVLVAHIGTSMEAPLRIQEENALGLPFMPDVDAIISGHSHRLVLDKINDIPIIQAHCNGRYLGELVFKIQEKDGIRNISFIRGDTIRVEGAENPEMKEDVEKYMRMYNLDEKLAVAKEELRHDNRQSYTALGSFVAASHAACFRREMPAYKDEIVIGVNHCGGIRADLPKGAITRLRAGNVLPFGSPIRAYHFTGKRLKQLLEDGRVNPNGYLQAANLKLVLQGDQITHLYYTQGKHQQEILDDTPCVVALDAFITDGGDGYDARLFTGHEVEEFCQKQIITTEAFFTFLRSFKRAISVESVHIPIISK